MRVLAWVHTSYTEQRTGPNGTEYNVQCVDATKVFCDRALQTVHVVSVSAIGHKELDLVGTLPARPRSLLLDQHSLHLTKCLATPGHQHNVVGTAFQALTCNSNANTIHGRSTKDHNALM